MRLAAVVSDAAFGPAAVVDRVIGLHGRDHVQLREAVEIFGGHVLRVLDAPAAVTCAVRFVDFGIDIEDGGDPGVTDGVRAQLQAGSVGFHHAIAHQRDGMHRVGKNAAIVGLVVEGLEEIGGRRAERAVGVGLERANAQIRAAESVADADLHLVVDLLKSAARHRCAS